jgi:tRNA A37 N6-isopentenylltransferase MiaA
MKLYEINANLQSLWDEAEHGFVSGAAPELLDQIEDALQRMELDRKTKAVGLACMIKNLEASAEAIAAEELALNTRRKSMERQADWLRSYLAGNLEPGVKISSPQVAISWRSSQSVQLLVPVDKLPRQFIREKVSVEADKLAIREAFEAGQASSLSGLAEVVTKKSIQLK